MEHNILIGKGIRESDKEGFFGPLVPEDVFVIKPEETKWVDLLVEFGVFQSKSQARKASEQWALPIPEGWTDVVVGKLKTRICILKISNFQNEKIEDYDETK